MIRAAVFAGWTALIPTLAGAQDCRQALALGLDVSGSVDAREYRLQLDGVAQALNSVAVRARLLEQPEAPVELLVFEWSGPRDQLVLLPWTRIDSAATLAKVIDTLRTVERRADATPGTALGVAMTFGAQLLATRRDCLKHTLDISGDGKSNLGPRPRSVKPMLAPQGLTLNALVIGAEDANVSDTRQAEMAELIQYFNAEVIFGPNAFVETASGFEDYARAMETKLLRELEVMILSAR